MKRFLGKLGLFTLLIVYALLFSSCQQKNKSNVENKEKGNHIEEHSAEKETIFPKGNKAPSEYFTGTAWVYNLVEKDSVFTTATGNVYFEPSARSNWHSHASGQILIVTSGEGYHQIKGQNKQKIKKGDVIKCPPQTVHWHGASENKAMSHIYIVPNTEKGVVNWMDPVTDEEYLNE